MDPTGRTTRLLAPLQQFDFIFQQPRSQRVNHAKLVQDLCQHSSSEEGALSDDGECCVIEREAGRVNFNYEEIKSFLEHAILPENATSEQRRMIRRKSIPYTMIDNILYRAGRDGVLRRAVEHDEARLVRKSVIRAFVEVILLEMLQPERF